MSAPERIGVVAARYLTRLRTRQENTMTATALGVHEFELIRDEQRARGWYLAWRCRRLDCDSRGNATLPRREKALELFALVAEKHRELGDQAA